MGIILVHNIPTLIHKGGVWKADCWKCWRQTKNSEKDIIWANEPLPSKEGDDVQQTC